MGLCVQISKFILWIFLLISSLWSLKSRSRKGGVVWTRWINSSSLASWHSLCCSSPWGHFCSHFCVCVCNYSFYPDCVSKPGPLPPADCNECNIKVLKRQWGCFLPAASFLKQQRCDIMQRGGRMFGFMSFTSPYSLADLAVQICVTEVCFVFPSCRVMLVVPPTQLFKI